MLSTKNSTSLAFVTEGFGDGQAGQRDAQAVARRLVHLAVDHRHLRLAQVLAVDDARFHHLVIEVVALAGALADAGEHRQARVRLGDVVDQFHHVHGLADAGAAEQADLAALGERADQVDDLDAGFEQVLRRAQLVVGRRLAVDRRSQCPGRPGRASSIGLPSTSMMRPSVARAHRHRDRLAGVRRPSARGADRRTSPARWCAPRRRRAAAALPASAPVPSIFSAS